MILVTDQFKNAIKKAERKIKGYVEILYDLPEMNITSINPYAISSYTDINDINNGQRVANLYGSLDYLPLDGSYLAMGTTNENAGAISEELYENITLPEIDIWFDEATVNGITLYYRTNIPTTIKISCSDGTEKTVTNDKECIQIIFDEPKTISSLAIWVQSVEHPDRKLYLTQVDLGITQVYKDQDLIEFTVDEEVNKLVEETPVNETNITLNNMTDLFNPLNPTGIVPYLSENTLIKPYIGVLTELLGVEYVKMGEFYFDSYTNNSDATTTLVGKNILKQVETQELIDDNEETFFKSSMTEQEFNDYTANFNYTISNENWSRNISTYWWKDRNLINLLKDTAFYQDNLLYANRDSVIKIKAQDNNIKDTITKTELIEDVTFKYIDKINTIKIIRPTAINEEDVTSRTILTETVKLSKTTERFLFAVSSPLMLQATISQSGGTSASIISNGLYMAFVKITGSVGSDVTITISSISNTRESDLEYTLTDEQKTKEVLLEFNSPVNVFATSSVGYLQNSDILDRTPSYEINFDYNGDPSLEAGDYINVETPYGYKELFIQKNYFKFDGGLEGRIEGVE